MPGTEPSAYYADVAGSLVRGEGLVSHAVWSYATGAPGRAQAGLRAVAADEQPGLGTVHDVPGADLVGSPGGQRPAGRARGATDLGDRAWRSPGRGTGRPAQLGQWPSPLGSWRPSRRSARARVCRSRLVRFRTLVFSLMAVLIIPRWLGDASVIGRASLTSRESDASSVAWSLGVADGPRLSVAPGGHLAGAHGRCWCWRGRCGRGQRGTAPAARDRAPTVARRGRRTPRGRGPWLARNTARVRKRLSWSGTREHGPRPQRGHLRVR